MLRDVATASILGLAKGGVADAFVIAFRIPNLFRRLFGEGALTAAYLPIVTEELDKADRTSAWTLVSVVLTLLAVALVAIVLLLEAIIGVGWLTRGEGARTPLLLGLTAVMLPYLIFVCLTATVGATLHALSHFTMPALAPVVLNVVWLGVCWGLCPWLRWEPATQAYAIAVGVLVAGVLQLGIQLPVLRRHGFRYRYDWPAARANVVRIVRRMGPMVVGLAVTQVNTLLDSLIAWMLARSPGGAERVWWLADGVRYPMEQGAAAAIYYGERLYNFPLGVLGIAVATAVFPLLSRHAARGDLDLLGKDLTLGLRMVALLGLPAAAGLVLLAQPLAVVIFEHGRFTHEDAIRVAGMIRCYAAGVWAFCAIPVVVRGFYALGDYITPVRVAVLAVVVNFTLNLTLIWPLAEQGLAVATTTAAIAQLLVLLLLFSRGQHRLAWRELAGTTVRTVVATAVMLLMGLLTLALIPESAEAVGRTGAARLTGFAGELTRVVVPVIVCMVTYMGISLLLGRRDLSLLVKEREEE